MARVLAWTLTVILVGTAASAAGAGSGAGLFGSWVGTYSLGGESQIAVTVAGGRATVALGVGHAGVQTVPARVTSGQLRFALPGRPAPVAFAASLNDGRLTGAVRQGSLSGSFSAHRGAAPALTAPGLYRTSGSALGVVDDPYGPPRLVDLDSGSVHALYARGSQFAVGSGFATRAPVQGAARFDSRGGVVRGAHISRVATRQLEVRFRSGPATLAGTLTIPPGKGRHAAVAFVQGSGPTTRSYLPELSALLVHHGVAVLTYDKRGIGQSGGSYPGESPTATTIGVLARDAAAAVRFVASAPGIDPRRVGLAGHSQAGWIVPLAATRESKVRFVVLFSGPAVTAFENDTYQDLAGQGDTPQSMSDEAVDAEVLRRGRGGVDPIPWIRKLRVPGLWLYGGLDKTIPARLSIRRLEPIAREQGRDFEIAQFPKGNHALVETKTGSTSEMLASDTFAPGLFSRIGAWLQAHSLRSR